MRKIILIVISAMALCAMAPAQTQWVQSWAWNKKSDVLPKDISNFAIIEMNCNGIEACRFVTDDMRPILMASDGQYGIDLSLLNILTEHMKYAWIRPDLAQQGKEQSVTNRGGDTTSKNRTVYGQTTGVGFKELNTYQLGDGHNGFGGPLDLLKARLGANGILLQADTGHIDQHELGPVQVGSQKRRNWLQDVIAVNIQKFKNNLEMCVALGRDGWLFKDPELQQVVDAAIENGRIPSGVLSSGNTQKKEDKQKGEAKGGATLDLDDLDNLPVSFTLKGAAFTGGTCKEGDELLISSSSPFRLQVFFGPREKIVKDKVYETSEKGEFKALLGANIKGRYRIEVVDPKTGLIMATITLEVKQ